MPQFAPESLECAGAKPNRLLLSSSTLGWSSLLLNHHEGVGQSDVFETRATPDTTLVVALEGAHRIEVSRNGHWRSALYQPGAAGLTPATETNRIRWSTPPERPFRTANIYLPKDLVEDTADEFRRAGLTKPLSPLNALIFHDPAVTATTRALVNAASRGLPDLYAEHAARWLVAHLLTHHSPAPYSEDTRQPALLTDRRLVRVMDYMSAHLSSPLALADLAREAAMSVHHFARRFKERVGASPLAYLRTLRMDAAEVLLMSTDLPISEIGHRCGYPSAPAFSAAFQRAKGLAPRAYRARLRR